MNSGSRIFKNLLSLSVGEFFSKGLMFLVFIYLARVLGTEGFGKLSFVLAFVTFFYITSQIGLGTYGTREIVKNPNKASYYLNTILSVKFIFAIVNYVVLVGIAFFIGQGQDVAIMLVVYGLSIFANALLAEFYFSGIEKMANIGIARVLRSFSFLVGVIVFVRDEQDLLLVPVLYVIAHMLATMFLLLQAYSGVRFSFNVKPWKRFVSVSIVIGLGAFLSSVNFQVDKVIIPFLDTFENLGLYESAVRVLFLLMVVVQISWNVFVPQITKLYHTSGNVSHIYSYAMRVVSFIGFAGFGGIIFFSEEIITLLFGSSYQDASPVLLILGFAVIIKMFTTLFLLPLIPFHKEKSMVKILLVGTLANIVLNLLLIPYFSIYGAAYATILSGCIICLGGWWFTRQVLTIRYSVFVRYAFAGLSAGFISSIIPLYVIVQFILFGIIYILILYILREITKKDYMYIKKQIISGRHETINTN